MSQKPSLSFDKIFSIERAFTQNPVGRIDWTVQLDDHLAKLATEHKARDWKVIALGMQKKFSNPYITAKKCRERWACCVNPDISKLSLTDAESLLLLILHGTMQNKWSKMSKKIPKRYSSTLKNNFYSIYRSVLRKIANDEIKKASLLFLLQAIYVSWLALQLLSRPATFRAKKGDVPGHILALTVEKAVTVQKCEEFLQNVIKKILNSNTDNKALQSLSKYRTLDQFHGLFEAIGPALEAEFKPNVSGDIIMESAEYVEKAIQIQIEKVTLAKSEELKSEGSAIPAPQVSFPAPCLSETYPAPGRSPEMFLFPRPPDRRVLAPSFFPAVPAQCFVPPQPTLLPGTCMPFFMQAQNFLGIPSPLCFQMLNTGIYPQLAQANTTIVNVEVPRLWPGY